MSKEICTCYLDGQLHVCFLSKTSKCLKFERESKLLEMKVKENEYREVTSRKSKGI